MTNSPNFPPASDIVTDTHSNGATENFSNSHVSNGDSQSYFDGHVIETAASDSLETFETALALRDNVTHQINETEFEQMVSDFNASHPNIHVTYVVVEDPVTKFLTASTSGQAPDVME